VHLQRFDQKVPVVAAIRTGQRHVYDSFELRFYVMAGAGRNAIMAEIC